MDVFRTRGWRSRWAAIGAAVAVTFGAGGLFVVNAASSTPSAFVSIDPVRILDTRDPANVGLSGPFVSATPLDLVVTGTVTTTTGSKVVVPTGATAVSMNVTVVSPTANGFVSIRPADATGLPSVSSLNFNAGDIVPNAVTVQLPTTGAGSGRIEITYDAYGTTGPITDLLIDVVGYYTATATTPALTASGESLGIKGLGVGVVSATMTAPANGKITVIADAYVGRPSNSDPFLVTCSITTGSSIDSGYEMYVQGPESGHVSGVRVFDVAVGHAATYRLNCDAGAGSPGDLVVKNAHLSAVFTAAA
jgi:hypothetical protein